MKTLAPIMVAALAVVAVGVSVGFGVTEMGTVLLVLVLTVVALTVAWQIGTDRDPWLWWVATLGFIAKLAGSSLRHLVLAREYGYSGDATGYHGWGSRIAEIWRTFEIPPLDGSMGVGTQVVRWITGLLYAPYTPSMLGGFFIFATLAYLGQILFYCAFRRAVPEARLGIYASLIFFLPAMVFWPSSIGKESLMILFLGVASYGMARSFTTYSVLWLMISGAGVAGAAMIRPHVAALITVSFAVAALASRGKQDGQSAVRRMIVLALGVTLAVFSVGAFADRYDLADASDVDPFVSEIERRTQQGGSAVDGDAVFSPRDLPAATLRVLFRPLPHEAHNRQAMASALESTALLALLVWKSPAMIRRIRRIRLPYVMMSIAFTLGFTVGFSTVFNLGILARQRSQVLPYLLAVVVAMGWDARKQAKEPEARAGRHMAPTP